MSNKASNQLFRLIKSLTKPEKRYFKIFSSRHTAAENNKYVQLFDAIDAQKEYDEEAILEKFNKDAIVNNFSIAKNRLYESVLRSMDSFHNQSSIEAELKRDIHCAEILYKKTLYDQCAKILNSAKRMALKYEKHSILAEIYVWEKRLIEKDNYSGKSDEELAAIKSADEDVAIKIKNYNDFWNIKSRFFMLLNKTGKVRSEEEAKKFNSILKNPLMAKEENALTIESRYLFHHIYSAYYFGMDNYRESYGHLVKNIRLIENNIDLFREEPNIYFSVLTNAIYIGSQLKKYDEVFLYLEKLHHVKEIFRIVESEDMDIKLFSSANSIEITLHNSLGEFEKSEELVPAIEEGLNKYEDRLNPLRKGYLYLNIAVGYFGLGKYSLALRWINRLLNDPGIEENQDLHCFAQILNLIVHIELKNEDLVPYTYRSTHRYLKMRKRVYKFETMFMEFIGRRMKDKEDQLVIYKDLYGSMEKLANDSFEKAAFEYFDFISWAKSKAEKKAFRDVIKEKAMII